VTRLRFGDRFAVEILADGGIAIDLATGDYTRMNRTAASICRVLAAANDETQVAAKVAAALGIPAEEAVRAIDAVEKSLARPATRGRPPGDFRYEPEAGREGYLLFSGGIPRLRARADGTAVRLVGGRGRTAEIYEYVRAIAPKLIFLRGGAVVHGAACVTGGSLRAYCGESGAGKTTTARAFARAGGQLFSEDLLVLTGAAPAEVLVLGENLVHGWARESAERLAADPELELGTSSLLERLSGQTRTIDEIWMLDVRRRGREDAISTRALPATEAAAAIMACLFLGAATDAGWRRFLSTSAALAAAVPIFVADVPEGVDRLAAAASRYTENSAS
jgi:hypothetical protein